MIVLDADLAGERECGDGRLAGDKHEVARIEAALDRHAGAMPFTMSSSTIVNMP